MSLWGNRRSCLGCLWFHPRSLEILLHTIVLLQSWGQLGSQDIVGLVGKENLMGVGEEYQLVQSNKTSPTSHDLIDASQLGPKNHSMAQCSYITREALPSHPGVFWHGGREPLHLVGHKGYIWQQEMQSKQDCCRRAERIASSAWSYCCN